METHHAPTQRQAQGEIDLIGLFCLLWKNWLMIAVITLVGLGVGLAFSFYSTPLYKTQATALPPSQADLESYNSMTQLDPELKLLTPEQVFTILGKQLNSAQLQRDFFDDEYLPAQNHSAPREQIWSQFNQSLKIHIRNDKTHALASVEFEGSTPKKIAHWANNYLERAIEATHQEVIETVEQAIQTRFSTLSAQIRSLRYVAEQERQNQIIRLQEALALANEIELELPPSGGQLIAPLTGELSYLRGSKALQAELGLLKARQNNDPYIAELPLLLEQQALLENIQINPQALSVATIAGLAATPELPFKPNKKLIVAIGFLLGAMISVFFVLVRQAFRNSSQP